MVGRAEVKRLIIIVGIKVLYKCRIWESSSKFDIN